MENLENEKDLVEVEVKAEDANPMMAALNAIQMMVNDKALFGAKDQVEFDGLIAGAKSIALANAPLPPVAFLSPAAANTLGESPLLNTIAVIV